MKNFKKLLLLSGLFLAACTTGGGTSSVGSESSSVGSNETSENSSVASESSSESSSSSSSSSEEELVPPTPATYSVTSVTLVGQASYSVTALSLKAGDTFEENAAVTIYSEYEHGYYEDEATQLLLHVNGVAYRGYVNEADYDPIEESYSRACFDVVMPSADAELYVSIDQNVVDNESGYTITAENGEHYGFYAFDPAAKYEAESYFRVSLYVETGFNLTSVEYKIGDGEWTAWEYYMSNNTVNLYFNSLSGNMSFRANGEWVGVYNINYVNSENIDANLPTVGMPGSTVSFSYYPKDSSIHIAEPATVEGLPEDDTSYYGSTSSLSFTMPANDVTITFHVAANGSIKVTEDEKISSYKFVSSIYDLSSEITSCAPGESFYAIATAAEGYAVSGASVNGGEVSLVQTSWDGTKYISLVMPETGDAVVTFEVTSARVVTLNQADGGTISLAQTSFVPGDNVEVSCQTTTALYELTGLTIEGASDVYVSISRGYAAGLFTASFTMPDADITITPVYTLHEGVNVTVNVEVLTDSTYFSFGGALSGVSYSSGDTEASNVLEMIAGEEINFTINYGSNRYTPVKAVFKDSVTNEVLSEYYPETSYYGDLEFLGLVLPETENGLIFTVEYKENTPVNITVEDGGATGYALSYLDSYGWPVEELGALYPGDSFGVSVEDLDTTDEYGFSVTVADVDGEPLELNRGSYKVGNKDIVITITKVTLSTLTLNCDDSLNIGWGSPNVEIAGASVYSGETFPTGSSVTVYWYTYASSFFVTVKVDGVEVAKHSSYLEWGSHTVNFTFVADGDVEITATPGSYSDTPISVDRWENAGWGSYEEILEDGSKRQRLDTSVWTYIANDLSGDFKVTTKYHLETNGIVGNWWRGALPIVQDSIEGGEGSCWVTRFDWWGWCDSVFSSEKLTNDWNPGEGDMADESGNRDIWWTTADGANVSASQFETAMTNCDIVWTCTRTGTVVRNDFVITSSTGEVFTFWTVANDVAETKSLNLAFAAEFAKFTINSVEIEKYL